MLNLPLAIFVILSLADLVTTLVGLNHGQSELNPLMLAILVTMGPLGMAALKIVAIVFLDVAIPRRARRLLWFPVVLTSLAVASNLIVLGV